MSLGIHDEGGRSNRFIGERSSTAFRRAGVRIRGTRGVDCEEGEGRGQTNPIRLFLYGGGDGQDAESWVVQSYRKMKQMHVNGDERLGKV